MAGGSLYHHRGHTKIKLNIEERKKKNERRNTDPKYRDRLSTRERLPVRFERFSLLDTHPPALRVTSCFPPPVERDFVSEWVHWFITNYSSFLLYYTSIKRTLRNSKKRKKDSSVEWNEIDIIINAQCFDIHVSVEAVTLFWLRSKRVVSLASQRNLCDEFKTAQIVLGY